MCAVVKKVATELRPHAMDKQHTLNIAIDTPSVMLTGTELDFSRIWRNLIGNAIKYTPERGQIFVRLGIVQKNGQDNLIIPANIEQSTLNLPPDMSPGDYLIGQVEDTGHGIRSEDFEHLFTRFYRGWAKESNIPGTGLGISLVRELLTMYGGDIQVASEWNVGSTFSFWLPIRVE
jgi:two-component system sensor histidine kinase VicK